MNIHKNVIIINITKSLSTITFIITNYLNKYLYEKLETYLLNYNISTSLRKKEKKNRRQLNIKWFIFNLSTVNNNKKRFLVKVYSITLNTCRMIIYSMNIAETFLIVLNVSSNSFR